MTPASLCTAKAKIANKRGLHARASTSFKSHITVSKDGQCVDARSIMGLMLLAAPIGSEIEISAAGEDAKEALTAIVALVDAKFGEE